MSGSLASSARRAEGRAAIGVVLGIAVGGLADIALGRTLAAWMNSRAGGWNSSVEAALLLILCSATACWQAARQAAEPHPTAALRYEERKLNDRSGGLSGLECAGLAGRTAVSPRYFEQH